MSINRIAAFEAMLILKPLSLYMPVESFVHFLSRITTVGTSICKRCREMISNGKILTCIAHMWFQQDYVTFHTALNIINLLREHLAYTNKFTKWNNFTKWPSRSSDLTPVDYFLWGHKMSQVYASMQIN